MIRELFIAAAVATAAVAVAPVAAADEFHGPFPGDPPGMNYEARWSAPCDRWDLFVTLDDAFERVAAGADQRLARSRVSGA